MHNNRPDFLSLRNIKRSQSVVVTTKKDDDGFGSYRAPGFFVPRNRVLDSTSLAELGYSRNNYESAELYREKSVYVEGNPAKKEEKKKRPFSCRRKIFLFGCILAILVVGSSVSVSYVTTIVFNSRTDVSITPNTNRKNSAQQSTALVSNESRHIARSEKDLARSNKDLDPKISMTFDPKCSDDESEILKWRHDDGKVGFIDGLEYDNGHFILPREGEYEVHVTLSIDVSYITLNKSDTLGLYTCVSRHRDTFNPIACARYRVSYKWAGQIVIDIPRILVDKKEVLVATITSDVKDLKYVKSVIRNESSETRLQIFYL